MQTNTKSAYRMHSVKISVHAGPVLICWSGHTSYGLLSHSLKARWQKAQSCGRLRFPVRRTQRYSELQKSETPWSRFVKCWTTDCVSSSLNLPWNVIKIRSLGVARRIREVYAYIMTTLFTFSPFCSRVQVTRLLHPLHLTRRVCMYT
jgi:hypothetical protein